MGTFVAPPVALAGSLVTVTDGQLKVNVLGSSIDTSQLQASAQESMAKAKGLLLSLEQSGQKLTLGDYTMDVSNVTSDLVTIQEADVNRVMTIKNLQSGYQLSQGGIKISVDYPIEVNAQTQKLTVLANQHEFIVGVSPIDIAKTILRAKYATNISGGQIQEEDGQLYYLVSGEKVFAWGNVWRRNVPVMVKLAATDGVVVEFNAPYWYKLLRSFLV